VVPADQSVFWHFHGGTTTGSVIARLVAEIKRLRATQSEPKPPESEPEPKATEWKKASLEAEDPTNGMITFRRQMVGGVSIWEALSSHQHGYGPSPAKAMISMLNERNRKP
jgi:hypothetical protein